MNNCIGVIAAHPDDEILGCGGAIARHVAQGDEVHILILAEGELSRLGQDSKESAKQRLSQLKLCASKASKIVGATSIELLDFPDNRMDAVDRLAIIKQVESFMAQHKPARIYTHSPNDVNVDHILTYESVITAARPIPHCPVKEILSFEVLSSSEWRPPNSNGTFKPNYFMPLSDDQVEAKLNALGAYVSEMRDWPHPRSVQAVKAQLMLRGATVGYHAAEAFEVCRMITP